MLNYPFLILAPLKRRARNGALVGRCRIDTTRWPAALLAGFRMVVARPSVLLEPVEGLMNATGKAAVVMPLLVESATAVVVVGVDLDRVRAFSVFHIDVRSWPGIVSVL